MEDVEDAMTDDPIKVTVMYGYKLFDPYSNPVCTIVFAPPYQQPLWMELVTDVPFMAGVGAIAPSVFRILASLMT